MEALIRHTRLGYCQGQSLLLRRGGDILTLLLSRGPLLEGSHTGVCSEGALFYLPWTLHTPVHLFRSPGLHEGEVDHGQVVVFVCVDRTKNSKVKPTYINPEMCGLKDFKTGRLAFCFCVFSAFCHLFDSSVSQPKARVD